jgi:hypothetical protein
MKPQVRGGDLDMMKTVLAMVLAALCLVVGGQGAQAQSDMTWKFQSDYKYKVEMKFFSSDRKGFVWPAQGKIFPLNDSGAHSFKISCLGGEKICYGAWVAGNKNRYWGVGADGREGCEHCCFKCQGGDTPLIHLK